MVFSNVQLILAREIRDQLRDRRTLFMIFVLPVLLYPLLGMSFSQILQFSRKQVLRVQVVGARSLGDLPPLFENDSFHSTLFESPEAAQRWELTFTSYEPKEGDPRSVEQLAEARREEAHRNVQSGVFAAALYFPPDFAANLIKRRETMLQGMEQAADTKEEPREGGPADTESLKPVFDMAQARILRNDPSEKSQLAASELTGILGGWARKIVADDLRSTGISPGITNPFKAEFTNVAPKTIHRGTAKWSKILPMLLLIWALTGAFYPAIDLCAGEKERGTLETLISSPAMRSEIVVGKLLTVMVFSTVTAMLNILSVGLTGWIVFGNTPDIGPPPAMAVVWLSIALLPVSALFSALCIALAAFARSTKEGQYYLMPLLLITMPLVVMPLAPGVELTLGNALIPITGIVLLLKSAMEGSLVQALQFLPVVGAITLISCFLAIRWAVDQFNSESVLFRESERLDVGLWLRHLVKDRQPTPTVGAAIACGAAILLVRFIMGAATSTEGAPNLVRMALITQLTVIAAPALAMTLIFTSDPRRTLLLARPRWLPTMAAFALAFVLHPVVNTLGHAVMRLYPVNEEIQEALRAMSENMPPFWQVALVMAVLPAVCEELAFRGFILSGFRHLGHKWRAIVFSALLFGLSHTIIQQSIVASIVGIVIGFVAVQSGSLLPCIAFHMLHNFLLVAYGSVTVDVLKEWPLLDTLMFIDADGTGVYRWPVVAVGAFLAFLILRYFYHFPWDRSPEEKLQEAISHGGNVDEL